MSRRPLVFVKRALLWIVVCYVLVNVYGLAIYQNRLYRPPHYSIQNNINHLMSLKTLYGTVTFVFYDPRKADYTVLFSHGNATDLRFMNSEIRQYIRAGFNVLAYDYNGYGGSTGKPSEDAVKADIDTVYRYLIVKQKIPPAKILVVGHSFGCAPSAYLASHQQVGGVLLMSPFLSVFRVVFPTPWTLFFFDPYNNARWVKNIHKPIAIIHGTNDGVIPYYNGRRLYDLANQPKLFLKATGYGHNNLPWSAIQTSLDWLQQQASKVQNK